MGIPTSSLTMTNKIANDSTGFKSTKSNDAFVPTVKKYNDSFISTVGNPTLGSQYGNHYGNNFANGNLPNNAGSQPMSNGGMSYSSGSMNQISQQPVSTIPEPEPVVEKPPSEPAKELPEIREGFSSITTYLHGNERLTNSDRKQLDEIEKALVVLYEKLHAMNLDERLPPLVLRFVQAILSSDLNSAQKLHQTLVKDYWDSEKVWVKPIKDIVRLVKK